MYIKCVKFIAQEPTLFFRCGNSFKAEMRARAAAFGTATRGDKMKKQKKTRQKIVGLATAAVMIASSFCSVYADRGALKAADSGEGDRLGKIAMESSRVSGFAAATVESVSAAGSEKADSVKLVPGDNYSAFVHYDISGMGYTSFPSARTLKVTPSPPFSSFTASEEREV